MAERRNWLGKNMRDDNSNKKPAKSDAPDWMSKRQVRWASLSWEPLIMYRRNGGGVEHHQPNTLWIEDWFYRVRSEEYIARLASLGFNCVTTSFHKGFGMAAEADGMETSRRVVDICHKHDIRVLLYVQSASIIPETFFDEIPEAEQWLQIDERGRHRIYASDEWRVFPCFSHDGYPEYVRKVTEKAVSWAGADGVHLDNTNFFSCQCDACILKFRQYLRNRYPIPDRQRFGIPTFDRVRVPVVGKIEDPIYQEAIRFRCDSLTRFITDIRRLVRRLNPQAVVASNIGPPCPYNHAEVLGVNHAAAALASDLVISENGNFPTTIGGLPVTDILAYKAGHATNALVIPSHWLLKPADTASTRLPISAAEVKRDLAESAAFGRKLIGATWATRSIKMGRLTCIERPEILQAVESFNRYLREYEHLYIGSHSLASVATYRNASSQAFAHEQFLGCILGYEQALIQHQIPFEVVFEETLDQLQKFDVLILSNVLCMSDLEVERVREFVSAGKGLVATGRTSLYNEDLRQRRDYGLADIFGASFDPDSENRGIVHSNRVIFSADTVERVSFNHLNYQLRARLPDRSIDLVQRVRAASPAAMPVTIGGATPCVAVEICKVGETIVVHLVNYENSEPARNLEVSVRIDLSQVRSATWVSFDDDGSELTLESTSHKESYRRCIVPELKTYGILIFNG